MNFSLTSSIYISFLIIFTYRLSNNSIFLFLDTVFIKRHALTRHNASFALFLAVLSVASTFSLLIILHKDLGQFSNIHYYSAEYLPMD